MNERTMTHIIPISMTTYAAPEGVRLELVDKVRGTYGCILFGNDSLKLAGDLIRGYIAHCFMWLREKINPFSSK